MKKSTLTQIENISGANAGDGFYTGFAIATTVYQIGILSNLWNPVGQGSAVVAGVIGVGCAINGMR